MRTRIKVCCISSEAELDLAIRCGADAIGLVGQMPSGPGVISDELIADLVKVVPPPIASFLLTSETELEAILTHHKKVNSNVIQLVDKVSVATYNGLKHALPTVQLVQVIHVIDQSSIEEALRLVPFVDTLLLDSGNPNLEVKELGGTGRTHNWNLSKVICEKSTIPVFLAGGLNVENVQKAIEIVRPFGVDLCSGVRTNGHLDKEKLKQFIQAVKGFN